MANTEIKINIDVESKSINQLEEELKEVNDQLAKVPLASDDFKTLSKESQQLTKELNKANEAAEGFTSEDKFQAADGAIKVMAGSLAGVVGVLGTLGVESEAFGEFEKKAASAIAVAIGFKDISEGIGQLGPLLGKAGVAVKGFSKTTRVALAATGIGLFIVALGSIVAYWDEISEAIGLSTNEVEKQNTKLEEQLGIQEGIIGVLESEKALIEAQEGNTIEVNKKLLDQLQIQIGITEQLIAQKQLQLADEEEQNAQVTFWEKIKLGIFSATGAYGSFAEQLAESVNPESEKTKELNEQILEQQQRLNQLKTQYVGVEKEYTAQVAMANAEDAVTVSGIEAKGIATTKLGEITGAVLTQETADLILKASADRDAADAAKAAEEAEQLRNAQLREVSNTLSNLGAVLDEESAAGKALAISSAIINTYLGVTEALKQKSTLPSPFDVIAKVANVATILATGFKAVRAIKSTPTRSASGGAPRGGIAAGAPGAPTGGIGDVAGLPQGNINTAPQNTVTTPTVQAYVLSGNVTSAQEADAKLSTRRNIG